MDYYSNVVFVFIFYDLKDKFERRKKRSYNNKYKNI